MTSQYKLTPAQQNGILAADAACRRHGIPLYYDFVKASAALCVALREGRPTADAHKRLDKVLEGLRNESADPRPTILPRGRIAIEATVKPPSKAWMVQYRGAAGWANLCEKPSETAARRHAAKLTDEQDGQYRVRRVIDAA